MFLAGAGNMKYLCLRLAVLLLPFLIFRTCFGQGDSNQLFFCLPLKHLLPTSTYGWRIHPVTGEIKFHKGVDLAARHDIVFSILDGIVSRIGYDPFIGNYILIAHSGDVESLYGHLSAIAPLPGEQIKAGQAIGITGATGRVTGEHLHFSIKYRGHELPPLAFLNGLLIKPP